VALLINLQHKSGEQGLLHSMQSLNIIFAAAAQS